MKIRVIQSDGRYEGGLLKFYGVVDEEHCWQGQNVPGYKEFLICRDDSWYLVRLSTNPHWTGSERCNDLMDHNSEARIMTPQQALAWCQGQPFDPPEQLLLAVAARPAPQGSSKRQRFTYARLREVTCVGSTTLRRYAKAAGFQIARGQRTHTFSEEEVRRIAAAHIEANPHAEGIWKPLLNRFDKPLSLTI